MRARATRALTQLADLVVEGSSSATNLITASASAGADADADADGGGAAAARSVNLTDVRVSGSDAPAGSVLDVYNAPRVDVAGMHLDAVTAARGLLLLDPGDAEATRSIVNLTASRVELTAGSLLQAQGPAASLEIHELNVTDTRTAASVLRAAGGVHASCVSSTRELCELDARAA